MTIPLHWAHPWFLLALLALPLLALAAWRYRPSPTLRYSDVSLVRALPQSARLRWRRAPDVLRLIVLGLLILAVARPQSVRQREIVRGEGVDIVLALDISGSMAALDFEPQNRLEAAKTVIDEFVRGRRYDRIGLVVFAQEAFSQCPPTFDYDALRSLLAQVDLAPELGLDDGTALDMGLAQATSMLQESEAKSRVIILLTDGVSNAGLIDPLTAAELAQALGVRVYAIGMGRPGQVPFPYTDPLFGRRTQLIESEIDEDTLRRIAEATDGTYYRATDTDGLREIYAEISSLEKSDVEVQVFTRYTERVAWVLVPALALLLAERLLRQTVFRTLP